jgi:hypothetical protein
MDPAQRRDQPAARTSSPQLLLAAAGLPALLLAAAVASSALWLALALRVAELQAPAQPPVPAQPASPVPELQVEPQWYAAQFERVEFGVEIGRERSKSKVRSQYNYRR